ncbi:MAG TPA: undecaprenyl-diphosphate phosphatase [Solirubrobacteraceae bacterium]|jgi:undecaprenyl-diphosphatase|nr:undecaprenyl-diphosphate phosphatase [Solirubrobacteraceae bacterium]
MTHGQDAAELPLRHAIALGLLQGPSELLPVSSSAHTALIPWLARWPAAELDPELRKSFEVALHAGTALALLVRAPRPAARGGEGGSGGGPERGSQPGAGWSSWRDRSSLLALSFLPPALVGLLLERPIERRLGTPRSIARGLLGGAVAMALTDAVANARRVPARHVPDADPLDALALGLAQAAALVPGVSRNGATLTAARARGFAREDSQELSWIVALPVVLGAAALKGWRLRRREVPPGVRRALLAGSGAAFLSTLLAIPLLGPARRARPLLPYALYRSALALAVLRRLRA